MSNHGLDGVVNFSICNSHGWYMDILQRYVMQCMNSYEFMLFNSWKIISLSMRSVFSTCVCGQNSGRIETLQIIIGWYIWQNCYQHYMLKWWLVVWWLKAATKCLNESVLDIGHNCDVPASRFTGIAPSNQSTTHIGSNCSCWSRRSCFCWISFIQRSPHT